MTRWPPFCSSLWLIAYAIGAGLWLLLVWLAPWPVPLAIAALGMLGILWLGNKLDSGEFPPREDRR